MPSKPKKAKSSSWIEVFKSTRGDPIPPKKVIPVEDRPSPTEADWDEEDGIMEVCVYCGEQRLASEFTDGLRCDTCREEDEDILDEALYPEDRNYDIEDRHIEQMHSSTYDHAAVERKTKDVREL